MRRMFALLGILLIASGAVVLGAPYYIEMQTQERAVESGEAGTRSFQRRLPAHARRSGWFDQVRTVAEKANAPLSIVFGLMSLYYTRRTYHVQRNR